MQECKSVDIYLLYLQYVNNSGRLNSTAPGSHTLHKRFKHYTSRKTVTYMIFGTPDFHRCHFLFTSAQYGADQWNIWILAMGVSNSLEQLKNGLVQNLKRRNTACSGSCCRSCTDDIIQINASLSHEENNASK